MFGIFRGEVFGQAGGAQQVQAPLGNFIGHNAGAKAFHHYHESAGSGGGFQGNLIRADGGGPGHGIGQARGGAELLAVFLLLGPHGLRR